MLTLLALLGLAATAERPNLVLISLDTTRYDALSCYEGTLPGLASKSDSTPNLCALAEEGVRFERFWVHASTTLSSHTTLLTGLDPHAHGVPRDGYPLDPALPTLAQRLSQEGWDSLAVVGAAALESSMGLDRGFRIYDERFSEQKGPMYQDRAEGVGARAQEVLAQRDSDKPLFLFVHFFDPHSPYRAPEPFTERFSDPHYDGPYHGQRGSLGRLHRELVEGTARPVDLAQASALYLGEVAYVDHHLGLLLEHLRAEGVLDHAIVVAVADHGEVLSELRTVAFSHGADVTRSTTRVPLIVRGFGVPLAQRAVVRRQASMSGLASTLQVALGLEPTLGIPFWDLLRPGPVLDTDGWPERPTRPIPVEATRPLEYERTDAWNNLSLFRAWHAGGWTLEAAPFLGRPPRLVRGPRGTSPSDEQLTPVLAGQLRAWEEAAPPYRAPAMEPGTEEALRALGYLEDE